MQISWGAGILVGRLAGILANVRPAMNGGFLRRGFHDRGLCKGLDVLHLNPAHTGRLVLCVLFGITACRLCALWLTPLGLDVEEAQYWLWSETPGAGYFTKPPLIAWLIGLTTALFGDGVFGIKIAAPLIHLMLALLMGRIAEVASPPEGEKLAGYLASLIWITLPGTSLGGFIISTDSPMLLFMAAAMLMLAPLARGQGITLKHTLLAGVFMGLAMLSKYAAIYLLLGIVLWWVWEGRRHMRLSLRHIGVFGVGMAAALAPNIIWNILNGFATVTHLGHNADLAGHPVSLWRSLGFLAAQAAIAGPLIAMLVLAAIIGRRHDRAGRLWYALAAPPLIIITSQAVFSEANANWAAASWPPLIILTAQWLAVGWHHTIRTLGIAGIGVNAVVAGVFLVVVSTGSLGPLAPPSDPLRRLRGWDDHARHLTALINASGAEAIITERRGHAANLMWQLREMDIAVELIDGDGRAQNHFEHKHPWEARTGRRVILVHGRPHPGHGEAIRPTAPAAESHLRISTNRVRELYFHAGIETGN